jgi:predicted ATPase
MLQPLRISTLGDIRFELNDEPVAGLTAVKAQALLIYLAVTGKTHTRVALAGLFWSDVLETAAHNSLRVALTQLRQAVGDYIDATRQTIGLAAAPPLWLDVRQFVQACGRLHNADVDMPESEYQSLRASIHLYRGDFLSGFYVPYADLFEEWVAEERAYTSRLALEALARLGTLALQRGAFAAGIEDVQRALTLDPLLEEAHQLLMQLYAHHGQTTLALRQYEVCVRVLEQELGVAPAAETSALAEAIRTRTLPVAAQPPRVLPGGLARSGRETARRVRHNLPHQTTPFVGRTAELAALRDLLAAPDQRLVTIVAPGGMGKSRLAHEAALVQIEHFSDGVYFVPLAPLSHVQELVPAIADAVNYPMQNDPRSPQEQLIDFLRHRELLLVLDNFEHLLDGAHLITEILQAAGGVKILVTSRERIRLSGETIFSLGGLDVPGDAAAETAEESDAVTLFIQCARRIAPDFRLSESNRQAVVQICRLTFGMPLGIVLAAAWVSLLTVDEIAAEIGQSLSFLEADLRDLPERQRSLASVFEYTWQRLPPAEREVFMRLAAFRGGFSRHAAQDVAGASTRLLLSLVEKALIQSSAPGRFEAHELLRQYGQQMLERAGKLEAAYTAHSRYFLSSVQLLEQDLKGRRQLAALAEIEADLDNLRAAWSWALATQDHAGIHGALEALHLYFTLRGRNHEGSQMLWHAYIQLDDTSTSDLRHRVLVRYCLLQVRSDSADRVRELDEYLARALAGAEADGEQAEAALCWLARGYLEELAAHALQRPHFERARAYLEEGLVRFDALHDDFYRARLARSIANCHGYDMVTMQQHLAHHAAGLEYARRAGSHVDEVASLGALGWGAVDMGQYAEAERYLREAKELSVELVSPDTVAFVTCGLAYIQFAQGNLDTAGRLAEEGVAIARTFSMSDRESIGLALLGLVTAVTGDSERALQLGEQSLQLGLDRYLRSYLST